VVVGNPSGPGCDSSMRGGRGRQHLSSVARDAIRTPISGGSRLNSHDCSPHMDMLGMASSARPRPKQEDRSATGVAPRAFSPSRSRNQVVWVESRLSRSRARWGERVVSCPESPDDRVRDLGGAPPPRRMRDAGGDARCQPNPAPHTASLAQCQLFNCYRARLWMTGGAFCGSGPLQRIVYRVVPTQCDPSGAAGPCV
jgi:hypothetical protein